MLLTDHFIERAGAHAHRQRRGAGKQARLRIHVAMVTATPDAVLLGQQPSS